MNRFAYHARDAAGAPHSGSREAPDVAAVARELQALGLIPLTIQAQPRATSAPATSLFSAKVSLDELILFSRQMSSLTRAGIVVDRALRGLAESHRNPRLRTVLIEVSANLEGGADLASSLRGYPEVFSELYAAVIHVGENTGRLDQAFAQIAGYLEHERETRRRIVTATRYPAFVLVTIGVAIGILNVFVIPAFAKVFEKFHAELPWQTKLIVGVSDLTVTWWPLLLVLSAAAVFGVRRYLRTQPGRLRWDRAKLRLPILGGIFERTHLARFCQTFAMTARAGLPITLALQVIARAIGNEYMAERISGMRQGIERGASITATAQESGMFTPVVLQMLSVGEETGSLDELMTQAAGFYEQEVDHLLKGLTDALEPVLVIAMGAMVLVLALGVFLPLWDLSSVATR
jgi:MSHA biogenesis protein MshG